MARFPHLLLAACFGSAQMLAQHPTEPTSATAPSPAATMQMLEHGNARFRSSEAPTPKLGAGARRTAARAQNPKAIVLCCSDAAAPPEFVFGLGLGELLVLRTAGHCLDAATVDAIEDAAKNLGATTLVVLGHDDCGAASLAIAQATHPSSVTTSATMLEHLARMAPSVHRVTERALTAKATLEAVVEDHAAATAAECLRRSPELQRLAAIGRFEVRPARYVPATGEVHWLVPHATPMREDDAMKAHEAVPQTMAPHVALRSLQAGNRRFVSDGSPLGDRSAARRATAAESQPFAVVLACSDARVVPEHLFDCGIGEIAVIRTPEAALTDAALASVELAVAHGGAPLLVVLGHAKCTSQDSSAAAQAAAASVTQKSAWLRGLEAQGRFLAIAASYDLESGDVEWLPEAKTAHPAAKAKPRKQTTRTDAHDESHGAAKQHDEHAKADAHGHEDAQGVTPRPRQRRATTRTMRIHPQRERRSTPSTGTSNRLTANRRTPPIRTALRTGTRPRTTATPRRIRTSSRRATMRTRRTARPMAMRRRVTATPQDTAKQRVTATPQDTAKRRATALRRVTAMRLRTATQRATRNTRARAPSCCSASRRSHR